MKSRDSVIADSRDPNGRVLNFKTVKGSGVAYNEHVEFATYKVSGAKKFVVEWEMKFDEVIGTGESIQMNFGSAYMMNLIFESDKQTYKIGDMSSTKGADAWYKVQTLKTGISAKDWQ